MDFGLFGGAKSADGTPSGDSIGYGDYINYILCAEENGYAQIFMVEHHFTGVGQVSASLHMLSYLAGLTSRIRLGTGVVVLPWHNPVLLAEQVATIDLLSKGRLDLGIGKGYRAEEFAGFCIDQAEAGERFEEVLSFLKRAWASEGRFSFQSKRWRFENIVIEPQFVQRPHPPLWMAAANPDSIRAAAAQGFSLLLDQTASYELSLARAALYRAEQSRLSVPRGNTKVALARGMQVVSNKTEKRIALENREILLRRIGAARAGAVDINGTKIDPDKCLVDAIECCLVGTPEDIVAGLKHLENGDIDTVLLSDATGSPDGLRIFAQEVIPNFSSVPPLRAAG